MDGDHYAHYLWAQETSEPSVTPGGNIPYTVYIQTGLVSLVKHQCGLKS